MMVSERSELDSVTHYPSSAVENFNQKPVQWTENPTGKPYRWGKFQGIIMCVYGLYIFILALDKANLLVIDLGIMCIVGGVGLFTKKQYGIVLLYITLALFILLGAAVLITGILTRSPQLYLLAGVFYLSFIIPALFYYPKRWGDFRE